MAELSLVQTAEIPFGRLADFDLVTTSTGPLLVGTHPEGACTWDPLRDQWAVHRLDSPPWPPGHGPDGPAALTALGALVVDGRIVVGGGSKKQRFAQWDLDSGEIRTFADYHYFNVDTVGTLELPDRSLFLTSPENEAVHVWDAADSGDGHPAEEHNVRYDRGTAPGVLDGRPVLVAYDGDYGCNGVWDLDEGLPFVKFDHELETEDGEEWLTSFALTHVGGRPLVVAAGAFGSVVPVDINRGEWGEPLAGHEPFEEETDIMVAVGAGDGPPIAVTCTDPYPGPGSTSTLRAWDLEQDQALGSPVAAHEGGALGVQFTELDGRPVAVTVGRGDASVRVWAVDR
ncbi:hypothetical protein [Streptomyces boluensis]|uniref:WD40 repeat domain-containing protein n=1 Tax=Streptomyces boluensis TaxID=1775135 RepID=A0A964UR36_9ACTN|nr:hypothetical protein [Streptomyces boluensis]NBE52895.1 hypothetical protein [Streptomyces boluensis]